MKRAEVSISDLGDNTVIAAVSGKTFRIVHLELYNNAGTATTAILKDGASTAINGSGIPLAASTGQYSFTAPMQPGFLGTLNLTKGNAFIINLSAANQVSGFVHYYED